MNEVYFFLQSCSCEEFDALITLTSTSLQSLKINHGVAHVKVISLLYSFIQIRFFIHFMIRLSVAMRMVWCLYLLDLVARAVMLVIFVVLFCFLVLSNIGFILKASWQIVSDNCSGYNVLSSLLNCYIRPDLYDAIPAAPLKLRKWDFFKLELLNK